jgi:hypothetical protein
MRIFAAILFSSFLPTCALTQDIALPNQKKDAISLELEYALFEINYVINYERTVSSKNNNKRLTNVRLGFGRYVSGHLSGGEKGLGCKFSLNPLIGNGSSFFESNFGLCVANLDYCEKMNEDCPDWRFWPIVNIGYRYQSGIIFRFYIGSLGVGIGLGVNF